MKRILKLNTWLLLLSVIILGYVFNYIDLDVVSNTIVLQRYKDINYAKKYNDYKEYGIDISEFQDDIKKIDKDLQVPEQTYTWDDFYIDTLFFVLVPTLIVVFGFSCLFFLFSFVLIKFKSIKYLDILKVTVLSYLLFYIPTVIEIIYFLILKTNYTFNDIKTFNNFFYTSLLFDRQQLVAWQWTVISDFNFIYIIFPALIAIGIKALYKQFSMGLLLAYSYITYLIAFVLYEIIMWYFFGF